MEWYLAALRKFADFSGRARRKEYWMFCLFNLIISVAITIVESVIGTMGILGGLYALALLIPGLAVSVRRLHDTGRSGWWLLVGLVPVLGLIALIVFFCTDSDAGDNAYGANPKAGEFGTPGMAV